jgi:hypothetical protein
MGYHRHVDFFGPSTMRALHSFLFGLIVGVSGVLLAGCGGRGDQRTSQVAGGVTYQGKPVPAGSILFSPAAPGGGPAGYADIVEGRYNTAETGKGVSGGAYSVVISGFDGNAAPDDEMPLGRQLFPEYATTLEIARDSDVVHDFAVPSRGRSSR